MIIILMCFDVVMFEISKDAIFKQDMVGIYRDDGIGLVNKNQSKRIAEKITGNKLRQVFQKEKLAIEIEPVSQEIDYLDVKLNLSNHSFEPYRKPNDTPLYLNVESDHPKHVIKHIPKMTWFYMVFKPKMFFSEILHPKSPVQRLSVDKFQNPKVSS